MRIALNFKTEGDRYRFRLGELISVKFSYTATTPGRYIWVSQYSRMTGGRTLEVACIPGAEPARHSSSDDTPMKFAQMLIAPCGGVGGGSGSGHGDWDSEQPLSATPLSFGPVPLNRYVRFRAPGTYECRASSAEVTTVPADEKFRPALLMKSNSIDLTIVDDPRWAHSAALAYSTAFDEICRSDDVVERHKLECFDIAARITSLDTPDSLATEVKFFDGKNHGWESGFWDAIQTTSHPGDALRLMTNRITDPDFQVSPFVLESLAFGDLRAESPDAFQTAAPALYHSQAIEKLRKYVRLLGSSLSSKNSDVLQETTKTYRTFAEQRYCEEGPLIPDGERNQVLSTGEMQRQQAR
jgi:hypothetical protein